MFEPEIPQNIGALVRLSACFDVSLALIEPFSFIWDPGKLRRSAMDYFEIVNISFFDSFDHFASTHSGRILATTPVGGENYSEFEFLDNDAILLGKESSGLPSEIFARADRLLTIPIKARSLNLAISGSILLSHALFKTGNLPSV